MQQGIVHSLMSRRLHHWERNQLRGEFEIHSLKMKRTQGQYLLKAHHFYLLIIKSINKQPNHSKHLRPSYKSIIKINNINLNQVCREVL